MAPVGILGFTGVMVTHQDTMKDGVIGNITNNSCGWLAWYYKSEVGI